MATVLPVNLTKIPKTTVRSDLYRLAVRQFPSLFDPHCADVLIDHIEINVFVCHFSFQAASPLARTPVFESTIASRIKRRFDEVRGLFLIPYCSLSKENRTISVFRSRARFYRLQQRWYRHRRNVVSMQHPGVGWWRSQPSLSNF